MKNSNYWTKEKCEKEALKYKTKTDFRINSNYSYVKSYKNGWLDNICKHMIPDNKTPQGYWTKEKCREEALKHKTRSGFRNKCNSSYTACLRNNWLDDVCSHLRGYKPHGYWTKEKCHRESLKYKTRGEFRKNNEYSYGIAMKNKWLDDICGHMEIIGNLHKRCIYVYEFENNSAYIGLTYNLGNRKLSHESRGTIHNYLNNNEIKFEIKKLTDYVDVKKAKELEKKYLKQYEKNGWNILNKIETGGLGGHKKWTLEKCLDISLKYKTRNDFRKNKRSVYDSAKRQDFLDEICSHMIPTNKKPRKYWTKEKCKEITDKYKIRKEFEKNDVNVYNICVKNGWLDELCSHMIYKRYKPKGYWTKEKCRKEAREYKTRNEFGKSSSSCYSICLKNKWLDEVCNHMIQIKTPSGYWTKEKCWEESLKYNKRTEFRDKCSTAYRISIKNKWIDNFLPKYFVNSK